MKCQGGHGYYSVRETAMVFELGTLTGLATLECYRCKPASFQVIHIIRGLGSDERAYCHAVKDKETLDHVQGMLAGGSSVGQVLEYIIQTWAEEE